MEAPPKTSRPPKSDAGLLSRPRDTILQRHANHAVTNVKFHESFAAFNRVEASMSGCSAAAAQCHPQCKAERHMSHLATRG